MLGTIVQVEDELTQSVKRGLSDVTLLYIVTVSVCVCAATVPRLLWMTRWSGSGKVAKLRSVITRAHSFPRQILPSSAAPFAKFRGSPRQILGIPRLTAAAHFRVYCADFGLVMPNNSIALLSHQTIKQKFCT